MKEFFDRMEAFAACTDASERAAIEAEVWDRFGVDQTVSIHDMSRFSRLTEKHGIIHYLSLVREMRATVAPIIENFGGAVVKFEADNSYVRFPDPHGAVQAAIAMNRAFDTANSEKPDDHHIRISTGIDTGRFLLLGDGDFFGMPVNTASKLGEDIASGGDILVSQGAMAAIPSDADVTYDREVFDISGIRIEACRVKY